MERTNGHLLGGGIRYAQPRHGFRSGIEPVLLAAAVPARKGERVLEGGSGAGAALLCLAFRVEGLQGVGIERDAELAALAQENADANRFAGGLRFEAGCIEARPTEAPFEHAMANPPYHHWSGTRSVVTERDRAKHACPDTIGVWVKCLADRLRPRGTLTIIVSMPRVPECLAAFAASHCGSAILLPLWPRQGQAAKLALVQGVKNGNGPFRLIPGLTLHEPSGALTGEAETVLRHGGTLALASEMRLRTDRSPDAADTKAAHGPRPGSPCSAGECRPD